MKEKRLVLLIAILGLLLSPVANLSRAQELRGPRSGPTKQSPSREREIASRPGGRSQ